MVLSPAARFTLGFVLICTMNDVSAQGRHALIIGGLGGSPEQTSRISSYLEDAYNALSGPLRFDQVTVLAERALTGRAFVHGESTADAIRDQFAKFREGLTDEDELYILLFGHGSYDGDQSALNIPQRDLTARDYATLIDELIIRRSIWICTMSSSGPFIQELSASGRVIITATRTGTQRNQTVFPEYLVKSLIEPLADLNRDGSLSVSEIFQYSAEQTAKHYEQAGHLATEHSLLDDNGDGEGTRVEALNQSNDGPIARGTWLRRSQIVVDNPAYADKRTTLEGQIALLKARKPDMDSDTYYAELEVLFITLARLNEQIEEEM